MYVCFALNIHTSFFIGAHSKKRRTTPLFADNQLFIRITAVLKRFYTVLSVLENEYVAIPWY